MAEKRSFCPEDDSPCYTGPGDEPEGFKCRNAPLCASFGPRPHSDDAKDVLKQELTQNIERLDDLDRQREKAWKLVDQGLRNLATARGVGFIRLETFRQEIAPDG